MKKIFLTALCVVLLSSCEKPHNKDISAREVFDKIAEDMQFEEDEIVDLKELKYAQRYGIAVNEINDGFAAANTDGDNANNLIVIRASEDKSVDDIEEAVNSYINDITASWESDKAESRKIEKRIFKTFDKYIMLYVGNEPEKAQQIFEKCVK